MRVSASCCFTVLQKESLNAHILHRTVKNRPEGQMGPFQHTPAGTRPRSEGGNEKMGEEAGRMKPRTGKGETRKEAGEKWLGGRWK